MHLLDRGRSIALLVVILSVAACSGSATTAPAGAGGSQAAPAGGGSAPAGNGSSAAASAPAGGGGSAPAGNTGSDARYCAALKVADAQALIKPTISAAQTGGPESCAFVLPGEPINGDNMTVTVFPGDTDKSFYNDQATGMASGPQNPLPGVGDVAVWEQPVAGATPFVVAHKGSLTCVVLPPADATPLTIEKTGSGPIFQVSDAAAAAYAAKEAVLCTDMFSVGS